MNPEAMRAFVTLVRRVMLIRDLADGADQLREPTIEDYVRATHLEPKEIQAVLLERDGERRR